MAYCPRNGYNTTHQRSVIWLFYNRVSVYSSNKETAAQVFFKNCSFTNISGLSMNGVAAGEHWIPFR